MFLISFQRQKRVHKNKRKCIITKLTEEILRNGEDTIKIYLSAISKILLLFENDDDIASLTDLTVAYRIFFACIYAFSFFVSVH